MNDQKTCLNCVHCNTYSYSATRMHPAENNWECNQIKDYVDLLDLIDKEDIQAAKKCIYFSKKEEEYDFDSEEFNAVFHAHADEYESKYEEYILAGYTN